MDGAADLKESRISRQEMTGLLVERLRTNVTLYFPDLKGADVSIKSASMGGEYAQTFKFELTAKDVTKVIYIKLCPIFERLNPGILEYETLQVLYARLPKVSEGCAVARPLDFYSDLNAYAMESVGTNNFKTFLLKSNSKLCGAGSFERLLPSISGCATWLKAFHTITSTQSPCRFDASVFLASIREDLDWRSLNRFKFKVSTLKKLDAILASLSRLDGCALPCAKWHWDYTPAHVFLDEGRISVIDITGLDNTPVYEDIGHFLAALVTVNNLPVYPFYDRDRADGLLCETFLEAYCKPTDAEFLLFANVYKLKYLLLWFNAQYLQICKRFPQLVAQVITDYRLVRLFEAPIVKAIDKIAGGLAVIDAANGQE